MAAPCFSALLVASALRELEFTFPLIMNKFSRPISIYGLLCFTPLPIAIRTHLQHKAKETRRGSRELRESVLLARSACDAANRVAVRRLARLWGWPRARTWCLSFAHEHWIPHLCVCVQHAVSNCLRGTATATTHLQLRVSARARRGTTLLHGGFRGLVVLATPIRGMEEVHLGRRIEVNGKPHGESCHQHDVHQEHQRGCNGCGFYFPLRAPW